MNKEEARQVLSRELEGWRSRSYAELVPLIDGEPLTQEVVSPSGTKYQIEIQVFWDHKPNGDVKVLGAIDDGGWRAFLPLSDDFILAPDGSFVGE